MFTGTTIIHVGHINRPNFNASLPFIRGLIDKFEMVKRVSAASEHVVAHAMGNNEDEALTIWRRKPNPI
jgi:hypothetical protein